MLTEAIINHIFQDVIPFLEKDEFWVQNLEIIGEENKPIALPLYWGTLTDGKEYINVLLYSLDNGNFALFKTNNFNQVWVLSNLDEIIDFDCHTNNLQYNCSIKQQAQFLLSWENIIDAGWSWIPCKEEYKDLIFILEKYFES